MTSDPGTGELTGYADRLSAEAGERIRFMVSTTQPAYDASVRRLAGGDGNAASSAAASALVDGIPPVRRPGQVQLAAVGSYAYVPPAAALSVASFTLLAWIYPTAPRRRALQGLLGRWSQATGRGYRLVIEAEGDLALHVGCGGPSSVVRTGTPLHPRYWYFVAATVDHADGRIAVRQVPSCVAARDRLAAAEAAVDLSPSTVDALFLIAAASLRTDAGGRSRPVGAYDGKIDGPALFDRALTGDQLDGLRTGGSLQSVAGDSLVAAWDLGAEPSSVRLVDVGPHRLTGALVNMPTRAVTSHTWTGRELDHKQAPEQYAAIHFHSDDLEDAGWEAGFDVRLPGDLRSGVYAAHLSADGIVDDIPFVVRPRTGKPTADVVVLMPTMTYLAYANERVSQWVEEAGFADRLVFDPRDSLLARHPEYGLSTYHPQVESLEPASAPTKARVRDCMDTSQTELYKANGEPYKDTPGGLRLVIADLERIDGTWRVTGLGVHEVGSCKL